MRLDTQQSTEKLKSLLEVENKSKMIERRQGASRHSRFGTTVAIKSVRLVLLVLNSNYADIDIILRA